MISRYLPRYHFQLMLYRYLLQQVSHSNRHFSGQYLLPVLRHPYKVHLQVSFRVCPYPITSHSDIYNLLFA